MADGSGEPSETFTVTQAQTGANAIRPLERTEATVTILQGGTVISTQTAPVGEEVHIAPGGFKVGSDYDPGRALASEATVLAGIGDSTIELEGGLTLSTQRLTHTIESEGGGRVILAEGGDPDAAAFLNTAVSSRASQPVAPWRRVVFQAIPDVGYFPQYPLESLVIFGNMYRFLHDSYSPVGETIAFPKMYELTLMALPEGGGNPECVGYIKVQEAKKYYLPGEEVQLTVVGQPGYTFKGWRGGAWGWLPDESEEDSVPIEWLAASTIIIKMDHTHTVIAEYCKCTHEGATDNGTLVGGARICTLPEGLERYGWNRDENLGGDDWGKTGTATYIRHQSRAPSFHPRGEPVVQLLFQHRRVVGGGSYSAVGSPRLAWITGEPSAVCDGVARYSPPETSTDPPRGSVLWLSRLRRWRRWRPVAWRAFRTFPDSPRGCGG